MHSLNWEYCLGIWLTPFPIQSKTTDKTFIILERIKVQPKPHSFISLFTSSQSQLVSQSSIKYHKIVLSPYTLPQAH